jgi:hypothetical protein
MGMFDNISDLSTSTAVQVNPITIFVLCVAVAMGAACLFL